MTKVLAASPFHRAWRRLRRIVDRTRAREAENTGDGQDLPLSLILATPPVATEALTEGVAPSLPIGVHVLGQDAPLQMALWALKSFYHFAGVGFPLNVHLQGQNTRKMRQVLGQHFPQARLVSQEEAQYPGDLTGVWSNIPPL